MKGKGMIFLAEVVVLAMILLMAYQTVIAAPAEELKLVQANWGNGVPLPHMERSTGMDWLRLLYDPLLGTTPDGKLSAERGLATKWEMTRDGLTWTIQIRKGVKFHDGVELTAKDVKFSLELITAPDSIAAIADEVKQTVKLIEIKDPYTLVIHCKQPSINLYLYLSDITEPTGLIVPRDYYEKVGRDQFIKKPIGTGPYKWHSQVVGSYIKLEATEKHWRDGVPRYKYVTFLQIPEESTRLAMLKTGEADITRISRGRIKEVWNAGLKVISKKNNAAIIFHCLMQWAIPAFSDIRFRKALNLAIDREAIIKNILAGAGTIATGFPGDNIFACGGDPTLKPYPYDPQEARRLIREGGYEGYEFRVSDVPRAGAPELSQVVEAVVGYWERIGLKPKIFMTEWPVLRESWRAGKAQNIVYAADMMSTQDCGTLLRRTEERYASYEKRGIVHDPKIDNWLKIASTALNEAEIAKNLGAIYRYAYDQHLVVPICNLDDTIAATKRIPSWDPGERRDDRNYNDIIKQR